MRSVADSVTNQRSLLLLLAKLLLLQIIGRSVRGRPARLEEIQILLHPGSAFVVIARLGVVETEPYAAGLAVAHNEIGEDRICRRVLVVLGPVVAVGSDDTN